MSESEWIIDETEVSEKKSEKTTRKEYIDKGLQRAGWTIGKDCLTEYMIQGMPNASSKGYVDYVCLNDIGLPLAIIEAKKTSCGDEAGRNQAKIYADLISKKYNQYPAIFLCNGTDITLIDPIYGEHQIHEFYTKDDLEKMFKIAQDRVNLEAANIDENIVNRDYQFRAVRAVCRCFNSKKRRALLVMATGSGKTRVSIAIIDILMRMNWVKRVLFLADRDGLVNQAKRSFKLLPNITTVKLDNGKFNTQARCIVSTYPMMMNCIERMKDADGKMLLSCGYFDLIVVDEAHRSIYNKYKAIFDHFDSLVLGMTATPKNEIDRNTYNIFGIDNGEATDAYELSEAVRDGYLVDYKVVDIKERFIQEGIVKKDLSPEEQEEYENTFANEDGTVPDSISSSNLNNWIFNESTISNVINKLMEAGLKVDLGGKLGKTIIFADNHNHAEAIRRIFYKEYPNYPSDFCEVIDNRTKYAQHAIDRFSSHDKLPQIAVSVDMLDTGIDIPEILNLVFFKKVYSKSKFWQMIGRGTRKCEGLIDGRDKEYFLIFDWCSNFDFFSENPCGIEADNTLSIHAKIFITEAEMVMLLQNEEFQTEELIRLREELVKKLLTTVQKLNRDNFAVRQHIRTVEIYSTEDRWAALDNSDLKLIRQNILPLISPYDSDVDAVQIDALTKIAECKLLKKISIGNEIAELRVRAVALKKKMSIPAVRAKKELIEFIVSDRFDENTSVIQLEKIRREIRDLAKYIDHGTKIRLNTKFTDEILSVEIKNSELEEGKFVDYPEKLRRYVKQNPGLTCFDKMKHNVPLNESDFEDLHRILYEEIGTEDDYIKSYGATPIPTVLRGILGLDRESALNAFVKYLDLDKLNNRQKYFLDKVIDYLSQNGTMQDITVLQKSPFADKGSIVDLFENDMDTWNAIKNCIDEINHNAGITS